VRVETRKRRYKKIGRKREVDDALRPVQTGLCKAGVEERSPSETNTGERGRENRQVRLTLHAHYQAR